MPRVRRWQYDDNSGERSIELFHVHVFIETLPFSFQPRPDHLYLPPHLLPPPSLQEEDVIDALGQQSTAENVESEPRQELPDAVVVSKSVTDGGDSVLR